MLYGTGTQKTINVQWRVLSA